MSDRDKRRVRGVVKLVETAVSTAMLNSNPIIYFALKFCWNTISGK